MERKRVELEKELKEADILKRMKIKGGMCD